MLRIGHSLIFAKSQVVCTGPHDTCESYELETILMSFNRFVCLRLYATYALKIRPPLYISLNIFVTRLSFENLRGVFYPSYFQNTVSLGLVIKIFSEMYKSGLIFVVYVAYSLKGTIYL